MIELKQFGIIAFLPENSISATITAKFMDYDGDIKTAESHMIPEDIYIARKNYEENYIDPGARYVLTEKGRSELL